MFKGSKFKLLLLEWRYLFPEMQVNIWCTHWCTGSTAQDVFRSLPKYHWARHWPDWAPQWAGDPSRGVPCLHPYTAGIGSSALPSTNHVLLCTFYTIVIHHVIKRHLNVALHNCSPVCHFPLSCTLVGEVEDKSSTGQKGVSRLQMRLCSVGQPLWYQIKFWFKLRFVQLAQKNMLLNIYMSV